MTPADALAHRTREFTIASISTSFPSQESLETLKALAPELEGREALRPLLERAGGGLESMRAGYLAIFDSNQDRVPVYETEYGRMRGLSKGKDLADVVGFYNAFGFELTEEVSAELPDHIAIELEFYALLLYKQSLLLDDPTGTEIVADARRKFLQDHLGGFARALALRPRVVADPVLGPLLGWVDQLVTSECAAEAVTAAPTDFFPQDDASEVANCGACVSIPGLEERAKQPPRGPAPRA